MKASCTAWFANKSDCSSSSRPSPLVGIALVGMPFVGIPLVGMPFVGMPQVGMPYVGIPLVGMPFVGMPLVGIPFVGIPFVGIPAVWRQRTAIHAHARNTLPADGFIRPPPTPLPRRQTRPAS